MADPNALLPQGFQIDAPDPAASLPAGFQIDTPAKVSGSFLPLSRDASGIHFDSDAGILGTLKRAVMLPGDVFSGKVDPMSPEGRERTLDLAATMSPASAAMGAGERIIPGALKSLRPTAPKAPSADALKEAADLGYSRARNAGVDYSSAAIQNLSGDIQRSLEADGVLAELSPKTFTILGKLQNPPPDSVGTIAGLDAARRALGHAAGDFTNKTEQLAARRAIERLDEFVMGGDPESVVAGPAAAAGSAIKDARGNYAAAARSDKITGAQERAELNAAVANSGQNTDNAIRQRIRDILVRPKESRGYSPEELALMERVARGTPLANTARGVGNLLGGGGGLGSVVAGSAGAFGASAATGSPFAAAMGATVPLAGYLSKKLGSALTQREVGKLDEAIRMRSPLYQQMLQTPPMQVVSPEKRAALVRSLLLSGSYPDDGASGPYPAPRGLLGP